MEIGADFLRYVLDRFRQADSSTTRTQGGPGLGLAILKQLVEQHGRSIKVKSPGADNGSIFILHLPLKITHSHPDNPGRTHPSAERVAAPEYQSTNRVGLKVQVVDDQADANELLGRVLEDSGAVAFPASSAVEGLD